MTVTFACGHRQVFGDANVVPRCVICNETHISRVEAPPARFRGVCHGPSATYEALPAQAIVLQESVDDDH